LIVKIFLLFVYSFFISKVNWPHSKVCSYSVPSKEEAAKTKDNLGTFEDFLYTQNNKFPIKIKFYYSPFYRDRFQGAKKLINSKTNSYLFMQCFNRQLNNFLLFQRYNRSFMPWAV